MNCNQTSYDVTCEWALEGLHALRSVSDVLIVVDVLSFSTAVDIAVSRRAAVFPFRWRDAEAVAFAAKHGAVLAEVRGKAGYTLSPASVRSIAAGSRLVLPSPNGSTLCLSTGLVPTYTACLRNASAVARSAAGRSSKIAVVPAGERWESGALRPCVEDLIGAGAVVAQLPGRLSPEAEMAKVAFLEFRGRLRETLRSCVSGRELIERGFAEDVELASEYDVSASAPILIDGRFIDAISGVCGI
ncbi:MAG: 2-phosphosulfolactate phosphatase [Acidobacteriaceae bacterium]|nr:2-phosphosulfolactate phosphatase [Acidobacteriaceae bacterium]